MYDYKKKLLHFVTYEFQPNTINHNIFLNIKERKFDKLKIPKFCHKVIFFDETYEDIQKFESKQLNKIVYNFGIKISSKDVKKIFGEKSSEMRMILNKTQDEIIVFGTDGNIFLGKKDEELINPNELLNYDLTESKINNVL